MLAVFIGDIADESLMAQKTGQIVFFKINGRTILWRFCKLDGVAAKMSKNWRFWRLTSFTGGLPAYYGITIVRFGGSLYRSEIS